MRKPRTWEAIRSTDLASIAPADVAGAVGAFMESQGKPMSEQALVQLASNWRQWRNFANRHGLAPFPLSVAALRAYKLECAVRGLRYETVGRYRQTLSDIHDMMGVAFIWSSTDVATPLAVGLQDGRSPISVADPIVPPRKAERRTRSKPTTGAGRNMQQVSAGEQKASGHVAAEPSNAPSPEAEPRSPAIASSGTPTTPTAAEAMPSGIGDLVWCHGAWRQIQRTLNDLAGSGIHLGDDEIGKIVGIDQHATWALMYLDKLVPIEDRLHLKELVAPAELAPLLRSIGKRLKGFLGNGHPKTMEQVRHVSSARLSVFEDDINALEGLFPRSGKRMPSRGADMEAQIADLRDRLQQLVQDVGRLSAGTSGAPEPDQLFKTPSHMNSNREASR